MKVNHAFALAAGTLGIVVSLSVARGAAQAPPTPDEMVAALKKNLAESQTRLKQYEWTETTIISLKGEEKKRDQKRVYYGADGTLMKMPVSPAPAAAKAAPAPSGRGGRGGGRLKEQIVENKKDEMQDYMERASKLIQSYVPPNPAQVQKAKDAGHMQVGPPQAGKIAVEFKDFVQPSDKMVVNVDGKALLLDGITVATYLEKKEDVVALDVKFGALADGTSYTAQTTLEAKAKNIKVVVQNSGHRPLAR